MKHTAPIMLQGIFWLGWLALAFEAEEWYPDQFCLLKTGVHYVLIRHKFLPQTGRDDLDLIRQSQPRILN